MASPHGTHHGTLPLTSRPRPRRWLRHVARWLAPVQPRRLLIAAGRRIGPRGLERCRIGVGALEEGDWLRRAPNPVPNRGDRFGVFADAVAHLTGSSRPLYLEFGVHEGRTLQWWCDHLTAPGARLVGFDSFDGLPHRWSPDAPAGSFAVPDLPHVEDPRAELVPGWFSDSLPGRALPEHDGLVINLDCDLYSSTREVLDWVEPHLRPGTLVYFDDLLGHDAELRAAWEWIEHHGRAVRPVSMGRWGQHLLVEYVGSAGTP